MNPGKLAVNPGSTEFQSCEQLRIRLMYVQRVRFVGNCFRRAGKIITLRYASPGSPVPELPYWQCATSLGPKAFVWRTNLSGPAL